MDVLKPAAEFEYSPRVRELFADMSHAGLLESVNLVYCAAAGSHEQGGCIRLQIELQEDRITAVRYQAYGCPHFLAASESLARSLTGCTIDALSQWSWRDVEVELQIPTAKRARLLLLQDVLQEMRGSLGASPSISNAG